MKRYYCDGAKDSCGAGWGFWVEKDGMCVEEHCGRIEGTSNEAEWTAVVEATKRIKEAGESAEILSDSQLVMFQLTGKWELRAKHLLKFKREALENLAGIRWSAEWIPRELNERADELSKRGILKKPATFPKPSMYRSYLFERGLLKWNFN